MEAVLCSKKRTDDYLWVINEVHVQTLRPSYLHGYFALIERKIRVKSYIIMNEPLSCDRDEKTYENSTKRESRS